MADIETAVEIAGGIAPFAKDMGVSKGTAYVWISNGSVPVERAAEVEMRYGVTAESVTDRKAMLLRLANERVGTAESKLAAKHGCGSAVIVENLKESGWDGIGPITDEQAELALLRTPHLPSFDWDDVRYSR